MNNLTSKDTQGDRFLSNKTQADAGNASACYSVGVAYRSGIGTEINLEKAIGYLRRAQVGGVNVDDLDIVENELKYMEFFDDAIKFKFERWEINPHNGREYEWEIDEYREIRSMFVDSYLKNIIIEHNKQIHVFNEKLSDRVSINYEVYISLCSNSLKDRYESVADVSRSSLHKYQELIYSKYVLQINEMRDIRKCISVNIFLLDTVNLYASNDCERVDNIKKINHVKEKLTILDNTISRQYTNTAKKIVEILEEFIETAKLMKLNAENIGHFMSSYFDLEVIFLEKVKIDIANSSKTMKDEFFKKDIEIRHFKKQQDDSKSKSIPPVLTTSGSITSEKSLPTYGLGETIKVLSEGKVIEEIHIPLPDYIKEIDVKMAADENLYKLLLPVMQKEWDKAKAAHGENSSRALQCYFDNVVKNFGSSAGDIKPYIKRSYLEVKDFKDYPPQGEVPKSTQLVDDIKVVPDSHKQTSAATNTPLIARTRKALGSLVGGSNRKQNVITFFLLLVGAFTIGVWSTDQIDILKFTKKYFAFLIFLVSFFLFFDFSYSKLKNIGFAIMFIIIYFVISVNLKAIDMFAVLIGFFVIWFLFACSEP